MFKFIRKMQKTAKMKAQVEKYRAKAELAKYKAIATGNLSKQKVQKVNSAIREIEATEALKEKVAESLQENTIIQILNNPSVQQILKAGAMKLMSGQAVKADDDELITLYKKMPDDIKAKVKDFAIDYIGGMK